MEFFFRLFHVLWLGVAILWASDGFMYAIFGRPPQGEYFLASLIVLFPIFIRSLERILVDDTSSVRLMLYNPRRWIVLAVTTVIVYLLSPSLTSAIWIVYIGATIILRLPPTLHLLLAFLAGWLSLVFGIFAIYDSQHTALVALYGWIVIALVHRAFLAVRPSSLIRT